MLRRVALVLVLPFALGALLPIATSAAGGCPKPDERPATADDAVVQEGKLPLGTCYNPDDATIGQSAEQAKQDLSGMVCSSGVNIAQLDAKFAVCANKFMQELRQSGSACIRSGYRSEQEQARACIGICGQLSCPKKCAPPGRSYHQKGLAIDVNYRVSNQTAWEIGAKYGIVNPGGLHRDDPNHMQPANSSCAGVAVPSGDQGDYYNDTNGFFPPSPAPPFDNQLRSILPPPPPPVQQQTVQPLQQLTQAAQTATTPTSTPSTDTPNSTPYPAGTCGPKTYCSQGDGNIYYRATTCVDQLYQKCTNGCTGLICNASSTSATSSSLSGLLTGDITNSNTNTNSNTTGTSSFDLISYFANPVSTTEIGTSTPIDVSQLIQDTGNASVLQPSATGGRPVIQTPPQGSKGSFGPVPQQTFTSPDLANSYGGYGSRLSSYQIALANIQATLVGILNYLRPFGGRIQTQQLDM